MTGPHLHFGVKVNGTWVDPTDYLLGKKSFTKEEEKVIKDDALYYITNFGDTLTSIAQKYNTTIQELVRLNNIANPNLIIAGTALKIPTNHTLENTRRTHTVVAGDSLSSIAQKYGTTWQNLYSLNKDSIDNPNYILPGWKIKIE